MEDPETFWNMLENENTRYVLLNILELMGTFEMQCVIHDKFVADVPKFYNTIVRMPIIIDLNVFMSTCLKTILEHKEKSIVFKKLLWKEIVTLKPYSSVVSMNTKVLDYLCKSKKYQINVIQDWQIYSELYATDYQEEYKKACLVIFYKWLPSVDFNRIFVEMLFTRL